MIIDQSDQNSIQNAAEVLKTGGILVFPTDTVYGIGCKLEEKSILKLYKIKNRPLNQPTAVLMSQNLFQKSLIKDQEKIQKVLKEHEPGKITVILNANDIKIKFPKILLKDNKIGIRIPFDKWIEELSDLVGPIVATSANLAGESTPKSFEDLDSRLLDLVDLVIKSNRVSISGPSTVYDVEEDRIIRA